MRSLQHGLGKRNPLFADFNAGVNFSFSPTVIDFNKTSVTAPVTENPFVTAPAVTGKPFAPADSFTSLVNNPNTANGVSLKP
jgi:hypothetical protein